MPKLLPSRPALVGVLVLGVASGGCEEPRAAPQMAVHGAQGVRSTLEEVQPDRYVIARELLVDSATVVVIRRRDGTAERLETPEAFAARLRVPDSLRARVLATPTPVEARAPDAPGPVWDAPTTGLPLGTALFYTMAMNVWRPEAYAAIRADTLREALAPVETLPAPAVAQAPPSRPRAVAPSPPRTTRPATTTRPEPKKRGKGHERTQKRKGW